MRIGLTMFCTDYAIAPHELAKEAEARGFQVLWLPEHTHIPASRKTPYPAGGELPEEYWHTYDPFGALCAAAAVTREIQLATGICLLIQRDTIVAAKEAATVDRLSGGRFIFGVGAGWNAEEMAHHGTEFATRAAKLREQVAAVRAIWTEEEAEFHGRFVNFDKIWCHPKPVQQPGPPVVLGGLTDAALKRVAEYGDGWLPIDFGQGPAGVGTMRETLWRHAEQAGRDPRSLAVHVYGAAPKAEAVAGYRALGVQSIAFTLRPQDRDAVLARLDRLAPLLSA